MKTPSIIKIFSFVHVLAFLAVLGFAIFAGYNFFVEKEFYLGLMFVTSSSAVVILFASIINWVLGFRFGYILIYYSAIALTLLACTFAYILFFSNTATSKSDKVIFLVLVVVTLIYPIVLFFSLVSNPIKEWKTQNEIFSKVNRNHHFIWSSVAVLALVIFLLMDNVSQRKLSPFVDYTNMSGGNYVNNYITLDSTSNAWQLNFDKKTPYYLTYYFDKQYVIDQINVSFLFDSLTQNACSSFKVVYDDDKEELVTLKKTGKEVSFNLIYKKPSKYIKLYFLNAVDGKRNKLVNVDEVWMLSNLRKFKRRNDGFVAFDRDQINLMSGVGTATNRYAMDYEEAAEEYEEYEEGDEYEGDGYDEDPIYSSVLNPSIKSIYAQIPYTTENYLLEDCFDTNKGKLELNRKTFGMYMSGFAGLKDVFSGASASLYFQGNYTPIHKSLKYVSGISLYIDNEESYQYLKKVNPAILDWIENNAIPKSTDNIMGISFQSVYNNSGSRFFHMLVETYCELKSTGQYESLAKLYKEKYEENVQDFDAFDFMDNNYKTLLDYYSTSEYMHANPKHLASFWLRRNIDGTDKKLIKIVSGIMKSYDAVWFKSYETQFN